MGAGALGVPAVRRILEPPDREEPPEPAARAAQLPRVGDRQAAAHQEPLHGARGGDVEETVALGGVLVLVAPAAQAVDGGDVVLVLARQGQEGAEERVEQEPPVRPRLVARVADGHHGKLEPLGHVDAHDLHGPLGEGARLPFAGAAVAELADVLQELAHADDATLPGIGQELVQVARGARLPGGHEGGAVRRAVEVPLQEAGDGGAPREGVEVVDERGGAEGPHAVLGEVREEGTGESPEDVPEGGGRLLPAGDLAQAQDRLVGEPHGGRAQQADEGEVVGGIGEGGEGVQDVAHLGPVVEPAARDGGKGDAGAFEGILVGGETRRGAAEDGHVAIAEGPLALPRAHPVGAGLDHLPQAGDEGGSGTLQGAARLGARGEVRLDVRGGEPGAGVPPVRREGRKGCRPGTGGVLALAEDGAQRVVQRRHEPGVGAVGGIQGVDALGPHLLLDAAEHRDVGPAKR